MGPLVGIAVVLAGILGGAVLARKIRRDRLRANGTLEGEAGDGEAGDSSVCVRKDPEISKSGKPYEGDKPVKGRASVGTYQWTYLVTAHETPGSIARRITGDERRYVELLSANSDKRMATYRKGARFEINFAQGEFCRWTMLYLPKSWNPWIDEDGNFAGKSRPFPPYDALPGYPAVDITGVSPGSVPWPPESPVGWSPIPVPKIGGL
jgi:hypothetical protein